MTAGDIEQAERIYKYTLSVGLTADIIREAIRDIDIFLTVFPNYKSAISMRQLLQSSLK
ncbi:hypothetical protein [Halotia branconii]|uniref:Uncharacterized protein n=1 Tax=Halotia branconii CENA392 TaxID=1539056 RepID=A0AAJ6P8R3_9CYAN|nr:hypothetical protein [Halotia branconii]WGV25049.1 hypothetical protein QI031_25320 [Halotia branconii CENA392]